MTLRVKAGRIGLPGSAKQAVMHSYDFPVKDGTIAIEQGWVDFSFLAQEQFARVFP
jgi:hypothetical protein